MLIDLWTIAAGFVGFGIFQAVYLMTCRHVPPEGLLKSLTTILLATMWMPVVFIGGLVKYRIIDASWLIAGLMSALALCIYGLLCFIFIIVVVGSFKTSIRIRLLREVAQGKSQGQSMEEILECYNSQRITQLRLQRLTGSGDNSIR